ncbi:MAG TPA: hypothetical protein VG759_30255 [Candidatus Angelobacter sp.]|jgi:hypothetical protein|nr:hypothetical protein [Candidatus Angelobacter sp.]
MNLRTALGIIVGDLIFVGSAVLLFYLSRVDPHAPAPLGFMAISIAYGVGFALVSGFVAGLISHRRDLIAGMILALIIAVPALISMFSRPGAGALWSQISALVLMAPSGLVGDWIRLSRLRKTF